MSSPLSSLTLRFTRYARSNRTKSCALIPDAPARTTARSAVSILSSPATTERNLFQELSDSYGGSARDIPNDILYGFIDSGRENLINVSKLGVDKIPASPLGKEVRRRCKQDLLWLVGFFLWETNPHSEGTKPISENFITEESHGILCSKFFVQKDETKPALEQSSTKNRLLLWPRGGQKTTCDIADTVQWVLVHPAIRVWFLTAADDLALGILNEFKGHFTIKTDAPTLMNLFFPEFCLEEKDMGNQFEFTCPEWSKKQIRRKEPTVFASSVTSTASGWHFEIIKADDAASDRNSNNEEQCRTVTKNFNLRKKTLVPRGYLDVIGTRYHDIDLYGTILDKCSVGTIKEEKGHGWVLSENSDTDTLILIGRALQIKPEVALRLEKEEKPITYREAGEDGCIILLPKFRTYHELCVMCADDEISFEGQLNQNPKVAADVVFDRPLLLKNTLPPTALPERGVITHTWDFGFSGKQGRDFTTSVSVLWKPDGTMIVHDLMRQRYKPDDLAKAVVEFTKKWRPSIIGIEKAAGSELIHVGIMMHARATNDPQVIATCARIDWFTPDNQKGAKRIRMAALHSWFVNDRLKFANYLPHLETAYSEFERCLSDSGHNDIPDVISQQPRYGPQMQMIATETPRDQQIPIDPQYNLLYGPYLTEDEMPADAFGRLGMGNPMQIVQEYLEPEPEFFAETPSKGMPGILGGGLWG